MVSDRMPKLGPHACLPKQRDSLGTQREAKRMARYATSEPIKAAYFLEDYFGGKARACSRLSNLAHRLEGKKGSPL